MPEICNNCHGGCCRKLSINITGDDILRLIDALSIDPQEFVQIYSLAYQYDDKTIDKYLNTHGAFLFNDEDIDGYHYFALKKVESTLLPGTYKCVFLQEWQIDPSKDISADNADNVVARCGVYHARPDVCKVWPFSFDAQKILYCVSTQDCQKEDDLPPYKLCPRELTYDDFGSAVEEFIKYTATINYKTTFFHHFSTVWNQSPRTLAEFLDVMRDYYKERVRFPALKS